MPWNFGTLVFELTCRQVLGGMVYLRHEDSHCSVQALASLETAIFAIEDSCGAPFSVTRSATEFAGVVHVLCFMQLSSVG